MQNILFNIRRSRDHATKIALILIASLWIDSPAMAGDPTFEFIRTVTVAELNTVLDSERSKFIADERLDKDYILPPTSKATNPVSIYKVTYVSKVPERPARKILATGMLAIPILPEKINKIPLISYQHGTIYGKDEVPSLSFVDPSSNKDLRYSNTYEDRYMVGLFAGNGYALMAADYYGLGGSSNSPEAYFIKASTQQANYDLYKAVQPFLKTRGLSQSDLFLGGWSQGGLNTSGFLEKLEAEGVLVRGSFTASNPSDPFAAFNTLMYHPRPGIDGPWANTMLALTVFAYENYYAKNGLALKVINPIYYRDLKSIYDRSYGDPENLSKFLADHASVPLVNFFRPEYADPSYFSNSMYGKLLSESETYRQEFKSPMIAYYGSIDEVITINVGQLIASYQDVLTNKSTIKAQQVIGGTHRLTFVSAAPLAKAWMDSLRAP